MKEEFEATLKDLEEMEKAQSELLIKYEEDLKDNTSYQQLKKILTTLQMIQNRIRHVKFMIRDIEMKEKYESIREKQELNKKAILDCISEYLKSIQNKPTTIIQFIAHLKEKGIINQGARHGVGIAIGSFLRSDDRFELIDRINRQWILKEITSSEGGQIPESSNETNGGSMKT